MSDSNNTSVEGALSRYGMRPVDPEVRERILGAARDAWGDAAAQTAPALPTLLRTAAAVAAVWVAAAITVAVDGKLTESVRGYGAMTVAKAAPRSETELWLAQLGIDHPLYRRMVRARKASGPSILLPHFPDRLDSLINNGG